MKRSVKKIPPGLWGLSAMILMILALTVVLLVDDLLLFVIFDNYGAAQVDFSLRLTVALVLTVLNIGLAIFAFDILKKKPETGAEAMIGMKGKVTRATETETWIRVRGELWRAQCPQTLRQGDEVLVVQLEGLTLYVEKL